MKRYYEKKWVKDLQEGKERERGGGRVTGTILNQVWSQEGTSVRVNRCGIMGGDEKTRVTPTIMTWTTERPTHIRERSQYTQNADFSGDKDEAKTKQIPLRPHGRLNSTENCS